MIAVVKCYKHNVKPLVIEVFEGHDEQTQKDANELAAILSRKNKCEYKVLIDLSCVAVINDSNKCWNSLLQYKHSLTETNE